MHDLFKVSENDRLFWDEFETMNQVIQQVTASLPSVYEESRFEAEAAHVRSRTKEIDHYNATYHFLMCDATICLHSRRARAGNYTSRDACIAASWRMMPVLRQILGQAMSSFDFSYMVVIFTHMFREFGTEHSRLLAMGEFEGARIIVPELTVLSVALRRHAEGISLARKSMINILLPSRIPGGAGQRRKAAFLL
ncbi:hypothetical protein BOTBODRAFT_207317 [Botryobasidium botryosum FD-172 SS1]|uniref:Uncharacterized protein n=1 Tax=Botryobasidium botryosum (strain FD-172 SS1) TaxID=930990 RepID=A0A067NCP6_BOTB1|nr:hypothetical protein BOTBODRAFT_207317 [Botryobasidium botryosum FD-172 SS1]